MPDNIPDGGQSNSFRTGQFIVVALVIGYLAWPWLSKINLTLPAGNDVAIVGLPSSDRRLAVLAPSGGEVWAVGSEQEFRWQGAGAAREISLYLVNENGNQLFRTLVSRTINDNSEPWVVDVPPGEYRIQAQACPGCAWDNSGLFRVVGDETSTVPRAQYPANRSLVVYRPQGGETWIRGGTVSIRWHGGEPAWLINVTLVPVSPSNTVVAYTAAERITNSGGADLTLPTGLAKTDYYLKLECANCLPDTFGNSAYSFYQFSVKDY